MNVNRVNFQLNNNQPQASFQGAYRIRISKKIFGEASKNEELVQGFFLTAINHILDPIVHNKSILVNFQSQGYDCLKEIFEYRPRVDFAWLKYHFRLMLKPGAEQHEKLTLPEDDYFTFNILTNKDMDAMQKEQSCFGKLRAHFRAMRHQKYFKPDSDAFIRDRIIDSIVENEIFDRVTAGHLQSFDVSTSEDFYKVANQIAAEI